MSASSSNFHFDTEQELVGANAQSQHTSSERQRQWGKRGVLTGLVALIAALAIGLLVHAGVIGTTAPIHWQMYHDPLGLFTLEMPSTWTAHVVMSVSATEMITLDNPTQGKDSAQVDIVAHSIDQQSICQAPSPRQSFSGLTLNGMEHTGAISIFFTENASFQVDISIPGVLAPAGFNSGPSNPVPISPTWVATDKIEVNKILVTFHPSAPNPPNC